MAIILVDKKGVIAQSHQSCWLRRSRPCSARLQPQLRPSHVVEGPQGRREQELYVTGSLHQVLKVHQHVKLECQDVQWTEICVSARRTNGDVMLLLLYEQF